MHVHLLLTLCSRGGESSLRRLGGGWHPVGDEQHGSPGGACKCGSRVFLITLGSVLSECTGNQGVTLVSRNSSRFAAGVISRQIYFNGSSPQGE